MLLHTGHPFAVGAWHFEPTVLGGAMVVLGLYVYALSLEPGPPRAGRVLLFIMGWLSMLLALISPLDTGADRLLSLHMLQHVVLTSIGPPLVLLGLPRQALSSLFQHRLLAKPLNLLTGPFVAATLFSLNMWLWHVPPVYGAALDHAVVHVTMHLAFIATALVFWWPVVQPLPDVQRIGDGARLLYLFVTGMPMGILALLLISSSTLVYSYYETSSRLWGLSAINDQQIAGMIMGALGEAAAFVAITLIFFRFIDAEGTVESPPTPGSAGVG